MSDFIVPPPGLVPDAPEPADGEPAGPERTVRAPGPVPVVRPAMPVVARPGSPRPGSPRPGSPVPVPPVPGASVPTVPPTPPLPARAAAVRTAWRLRTDDGVEVVVEGRAVLGRDPKPADGAAGARLVALDDPARSVSKTHAMLEVVEDRLLATDLGSTNGVRIWAEGEDPIELEAGRPTSVPEGAVLLLGDLAFLVDRASDDTV